MKSQSARHAHKRLHHSQGAQDLWHRQFDRRYTDRCADRHCRRHFEFGKQSGKSAGSPGTAKQEDRIRVRDDRLRQPGCQALAEQARHIRSRALPPCRIRPGDPDAGTAAYGRVPQPVALRLPDPNFFHRVPKSFPATDGQRVYFGSDCGIFWCLYARDGSVVWQFRVNAAGHKNLWSSPALHDGRVYFGSYDGNVYCLDAAQARKSGDLPAPTG